MKKVLISAILALSPVLALATQWDSPTLCPGVNTSDSDQPASLTPSGDMYKIRNYTLYFHSYSGSYSWSSTEQECSGIGVVNCIAISPDKTEGYAPLNEGNLYHLASSDGINWNQELISSEWNRNPHWAMSVTCAWWDSQKWLYVAYEDGVVWGDAYPYDNPQEINTEGFSQYVTVNFSGNYMVVADSLDLFELTGYGDNWSGRTSIDEINTGYEERQPVLGKIDAEEEAVLLWSAPGSVGSYDIWYSTGNSTANIQPTSLGNIKAIFK